ncbi:MAG: iron-sulfur cluster-binding domain-containing protein [Algicola sp.]|nr:iron-sulfur cluster-binding domain-containing protein [Algicola sp.]
MKKLFQRISQWIAQNLFHHQSLSGYAQPLIQWFKPGWRSHAWRAKVVVMQQVKADVIELELEVAGSWPSHQAGQHVQLTVEMNGRLTSRVFTIASSEQLAQQQRRIRLVIKQYSRGQFTPKLAEFINTGDWLNISRPMGEFTLPDTASNTTRPVLMIAGGSGITPFIALLETHLAKLQQPVSLLYFAKKDQHLFNEALASMALSHKHFSYQLLVRETDGDIANHLDLDDKPWVMMCGPAALTSSTHKALDAVGHNDDLRIQEQFQPTSQPLQSDCDKPVTIGLKLQGLYQKLTLKKNDNLLSQLEQQGVAVSSGCRMGVCHQCQCVKRSGIVRDTRSGQLSAPGEQLIQLCVSQPLGALELEL